MYNPYAMPNPYATGYFGNDNQPQLHNRNPNIMPPQQVLQVNGKASIDTLQMSPNSSLLAMDTTAPIVWLCVSDGVGRVTATDYDITPHQAKAEIDIENVAQRLTNVETIIASLEDKINAKPDVENVAADRKSESITEQSFANKKFNGRT